MRFLLPLVLSLSACSVSSLLPGEKVAEAPDLNGICAAGEVEVVAQKMGRPGAARTDAAPESVTCLKPGADLEAWIAKNHSCGTRLQLRPATAAPEALAQLREETRECKQAMMKGKRGSLAQRGAKKMGKGQLARQAAGDQVAKAGEERPFAPGARRNGRGAGMKARSQAPASAESVAASEESSESVTQ